MNIKLISAVLGSACLSFACSLAKAEAVFSNTSIATASIDLGVGPPGRTYNFTFRETLGSRASPEIVGDQVDASVSFSSSPAGFDGTGGDYTFIFHNGTVTETATGPTAGFTLTQPGSFTIVVTEGSVDVHGHEIFLPSPISVGDDVIAAPVPEPSTWAMLLIGFAGIGFAYRRELRSKFSVGLA